MRVKLGPIITDARGTQGDVIHSVWKAGCHYTRTEPESRTDPESDMQLLMRECKSCALEGFAALTASEKGQWEEYAQQFVHRNQDLDQGGGTTNLIPHHRPPISGQMAFVQAYLRLCRCRVETFSTPATSSQPVLVEDLAIAWDAVNNELDVTWNDPPADSYDGTTHIDENFEDEAVGTNPNAWTPAWAYNQSGTERIECANDQSHSATKSLKQIPGTGVCNATYQIAALANSPSAVVDYWFRVDNSVAHTHLINLTDHPVVNHQVAVDVRLGNLEYYDGAVLKVACAIASDTWYHIRYVLHVVGRTWDLFLNDMCTPLVADIDYHNNLDCEALFLQPHIDTSWIDDIIVVTNNQILRLWGLSYNAPMHKQILCCAPIELGEAHPTNARYAAGALDLLDNNKGDYYFQVDTLGITQSQNGLLSVPSEIFRIVIN